MSGDCLYDPPPSKYEGETAERTLKKKRTTCRLFHDWSKWRIVKLTTTYKGQQVPADAQIRTCQRCGRVERDIL
jgi:hypothetical protein